MLADGTAVPMIGVATFAAALSAAASAVAFLSRGAQRP
jgi:hypothetical protein